MLLVGSIELIKIYKTKYRMGLYLGFIEGIIFIIESII
jgi:hypothetical protein